MGNVTTTSLGTRFPDLPPYSGFNHPGASRRTFFELEVEGGCPPISRVRLSRLAPEPQFPPLLGDDIVLNGDGMVGMFRFTSGHVDFSSRYVRIKNDIFRA
jgi:carotenoid cleavage dioxygenase-like enzyme